jgi:flagellar hook-length control protein FliK
MQVPPTPKPSNSVQSETASKVADASEAKTPFVQVLEKEVSDHKGPAGSRAGKKSDSVPGKLRKPIDSSSECQGRETAADIVDSRLVVAAKRDYSVRATANLVEAASPTISAQAPTPEAKDQESPLSAPEDLLTVIGSTVHVSPPPVPLGPKPNAGEGFDTSVTDVLDLPTGPPDLTVRLIAGTASPGFPEIPHKLSALKVSEGVTEPLRQDPSEGETVIEKSLISLAVEAHPRLSVSAGSLESALVPKLTAHGELQPQPNVAASAVPISPLATSSAEPSDGGGTARASDKLQARVGTTAWEAALGQKVCWMLGDQQHTASLRLDPPELGPLQVVLTVDNNQANATFFAAEPEVRRAIEAAMPRLREMMDAVGIQLGDATVGAGTSSDDNTSPGAKHLSENRPWDGRDEAGSVPANWLEVRPVSRGLVDIFA